MGRSSRTRHTHSSSRNTETSPGCLCNHGNCRTAPPPQDFSPHLAGFNLPSAFTANLASSIHQGAGPSGKRTLRSNKDSHDPIGALQGTERESTQLLLATLAHGFFSHGFFSLDQRRDQESKRLELQHVRFGMGEGDDHGPLGLVAGADSASSSLSYELRLAYPAAD